jgi:hypothetical protein
MGETAAERTVSYWQATETPHQPVESRTISESQIQELGDVALQTALQRKLEEPEDKLIAVVVAKADGTHLMTYFAPPRGVVHLPLHATEEV